MKEYDLYIFDFDGTLFNTIDSLSICYKESFKMMGIVIKDDEIKHLMQQSLKTSALEKGIHESQYKDFVTIFNSYQEDKDIICFTKPFSDVKSTLLSLKKNGKKLAIVSGNSEFHIKRVLNLMKYDINLFDQIVGYESFKKPKPNGEPLLVCLDMLNCLDKKEKSIYIGDSPHDDLQCAESAGIDGVLIDRNLAESNIQERIINNLNEVANF